MNKVLEEILSTGNTMTPDGGTIKVHGNIDRRRCNILTHIVQEIMPAVTLEVGLAYGLSALTICDALIRTSRSKHIVIDPHQNIQPVWGGIGLYNLERAGFGDLIEFYEQPSYRALPILESRNIKIDFAFIDGWHTFDYTLVDFFYIDKMLKEEGIVVFDDADWPSVRNVCRFIATNLDYKPYNLPEKFFTREEHSSDINPKQDNSSATPLQTLSRLLYKYTPNRGQLSSVSDDIKLGLIGNFVAFRKGSDDSRKWNHYIPF